MNGIEDEISKDSDEALVVPAKGLAKILSTSVCTVWRWKSAGKLPEPLTIGGNVRWRQSDIKRWLESDCPDRKTFESFKMAVKMKAVARKRRTTARSNKRQKGGYPLSILKNQIGKLLLDLQDPSLDENQRRKLWRIFERKLRHYIGLRYCFSSYREKEGN
jgi:predicted DNA-binding transcriptional regulator AlpA